MAPSKPHRTALLLHRVPLDWRWFWRGALHVQSAYQDKPYDYARHAFMLRNTIDNAPARITTDRGLAFSFNAGSRNSEHWAIPNSANNLLDGRNTFTFGMLVRTNYGSSSPDEDTLFGHWDGLDGAASKRKKWMTRWDSTAQDFETYASSDGTTDQAVGAWAAGAFDDGEWHTLVVVALNGSVTGYMDAVSIGTGSFTGTISSGADSSDWEFPGGHATTKDAGDGNNDSPRVDLLTGFVSSEAWSLGQVIMYAQDPFGPFRTERRVSVLVPEQVSAAPAGLVSIYAS